MDQAANSRYRQAGQLDRRLKDYGKKGGQIKTKDWSPAQGNSVIRPRPQVHLAFLVGRGGKKVELKKRFHVLGGQTVAADPPGITSQESMQSHPHGRPVIPSDHGTGERVQYATTTTN